MHHRLPPTPPPPPRLLRRLRPHLWSHPVGPVLVLPHYLAQVIASSLTVITDGVTDRDLEDAEEAAVVWVKRGVWNAQCWSWPVLTEAHWSQRIVRASWVSVEKGECRNEGRLYQRGNCKSILCPSAKNVRKPAQIFPFNPLPLRWGVITMVSDQNKGRKKENNCGKN